MCTAISKGNLFGRNLDLDYSIDGKVIFIPRNHPFTFLHLDKTNNHYAILGIGLLVDDYPLYFDAFNECGLAGAGLNFPDNAKFNQVQENKNNLSPYELLPYVLSHFKNADEVEAFLKTANLIDVPFSKDIPLAPLHYIFADKNRSIVLEQDKDGLHVYDNSVNVLTNNPIFPIHLNNVKQLSKISNEYFNDYVKSLNIIPDSVGFGSFGLPGDYSSRSRFLKAAYLTKYVNLPDDEEKKIIVFIDMLKSLSFFRGVALSKRDEQEKTIYSSCMNLNNLSYSYRLEYSNSLRSVEINPSLDNIATWDLIE